MADEEEASRGRPLLRDDVVDNIIKCRKLFPKHITKAYDRGKMTVDNGHLRRNIDLICDGYKLRMSMRQLIDDPLDFSVLLIYTGEAGHTYIIRRYNGDHGSHRDLLTGMRIEGPHIHMITERHQLDSHREERHAVPTDRYNTLQQAVDAFVNDLNIRYESVKEVVPLEEFHG